MIERLQYITQDHLSKSHVDLCREACEAGVKWVQLRVKDQSDSTYLEWAHECRQITKRYDVTLIINDRLDIALESGADGVHLGQEDLDTDLARKSVGKNFIIGGTANTLEQIERHTANGVDYIGFGPFRFTQTKKNLNPVLGLESYRQLMFNLHTYIPIIAVGGIELNDIPELYKTGVYGIAVSSLITNSLDMKGLIKTISKF